MCDNFRLSAKQAFDTCDKISKCFLFLLATIVFYPISGWSEMITLNPTKDTYVNESSPNSSYGSNQTLPVQFTAADTTEALFQFDLSGIPQGALIIGASLELYNKSSTNFVSGNAGVYATQGSWTESTTTWNTKPPAAPASEDITDVTSTNQYFEWDITDLVQDWADGVTNNGVTIRVEEGGRLFFSSREALNKPILEVEYTESIPTPTPTPTPTPPTSSNPWKYSTGRTFDIICVVDDDDTETEIEGLAAIGVCQGFMDAWGMGSGNVIKNTPGNTADWVIPYFDFGNNKETAGSSHDRNWFDTVVKPNHPEWILKEDAAPGNPNSCGNGRWIRLNATDKISYAMDIGSKGSIGSSLDPAKYVDRWAKELIDAYQQNGWDGVWADNVHHFESYQSNSFCYENTNGTLSNCGNAIPCNRRTGRNYTELEYNTDLKNTYTRLKELFDPHSLFFMANNSVDVWRSYLLTTNPETEDMIRNLDVLQIEDFALRFGGSSIYKSFTQWKEQMEVVQRIYKENNPTVLFRTVADGCHNNTNCKFFRDASWLLVKEFNMAQRTRTMMGLNAIESWWLPTNTNLGQSQGDMFVVPGTEVRRRNYQSGIVLVNPHDTISYNNISLGKSCTNVQTGATGVTSVSMTPKKGVILKNCN